MKYLLILFLFITACAKPVVKEEVKPCPEAPERIVYVPVPIILPEKPIIPRIKGSDLKCLSNKTKEELRNRDAIMKDYIDLLETTIQSTK